MSNKATCEALRACCSTYEKASTEQQEIIKDKAKENKRLLARVAKLERIILNNVKSGENFIK